MTVPTVAAPMDETTTRPGVAVGHDCAPVGAGMPTLVDEGEQ